MNMSEQRFKQFGLWIIDDPNLNVVSVADLVDTKIMSTNEVVGVLNEQQATISALKEENEQLRKEHQEMLEKYVLLKLKMGEVLNDE